MPPAANAALADALAYRLVDGPLLHHACIAAWRLGLLDAVATGPPPTMAALARRLRLPLASVRAMVAAAVALGLLERPGPRRDAGLRPTPVAAPLLDCGAGGHGGALLDLGVALHRDAYRYGALEAALRRGRADGRRAAPWNGGSVDRFVAAMHAHSLAPARHWVPRVELGRARRLLDLGAGAGTHAIEALRVHPRLRAVLFDLEPVCAAASPFHAASGVAGRFTVQPGDFFRDPLPEADVVLLSDVLHDWPEPAIDALLGRVARALPPGGRLLVHEMALDDDGLGPPEAVASSLAMALLCGGRQFTRPELRQILLRAGFDRVEIHPGLGCWTLLEARRTRRRR